MVREEEGTVVVVVEEIEIVTGGADRTVLVLTVKETH